MKTNHVIQDASLIVEHPFLKKYEAQSTAPVEIGAVYYRRSNPPEYDWERDYRVAREDGHTMFRHWFTWNSIHIAPDVFDFENFDKHLALAAKYGIKTIIAEHIYEAPDWLYHKYPHARLETANGSRFHSYMGHSNAIGLTKMCLDNPEVLTEAKRFLFELAKHYRDNPGLYGYDIWNECSLYDARSLCYCPATQAAFRTWLREKYNDNLDKLRNAWRRYSITNWDEVEMPRQIQPFPDTMDMVHFQNDKAQEWFKMRRDTIREADRKNFIVAHGNAKHFCDIPACGDDFRPVEHVDIYGYTFWYGNHCHTMLGSDMIRIASAGKEFWRAEAIGNSDWQDRGGKTGAGPLPIEEKDVMGNPANIRLDALESFAAGSRGFINPRWRALQEGPLFDGFGWYNLDGTRSERSDEIKKIAQWANDPKNLPLWKAQPVKGQVGLLLLEDAQIFCYSFYRSTDYYSLAYQGAYEAFLDSNIQADPIILDRIDNYDILYLPFPIALADTVIEKLIKWVEKGGTLIAEGCFAYFSAGGHAYEHQPGRGLDALVGAKQDTVSFAPDRWQGLEFSSAWGRSSGGVFRQSFVPTTGKAVAWYDDGKAAIVENSYGKGKVRTIGTMAGYGYKLTKGNSAGACGGEPSAGKRQNLGLFASALPFAGVSPLIRADYNTGLIPRIWANNSETFLWCLNQECYPQEVILELNDKYLSVGSAEILRGGQASVTGRLIRFSLPGRDAAVYRLNI
ncbi:beta-galactosidase [Spirochaetia bacterium]|nr:beta-galactosidase [Spirochaetia bacterium]